MSKINLKFRISCVRFLSLKGHLTRVNAGEFTKGQMASDRYSECPDEIINWKEYLDGKWGRMGNNGISVRCLEDRKTLIILFYIRKKGTDS